MTIPEAMRWLEEHNGGQCAFGYDSIKKEFWIDVSCRWLPGEVVNATGAIPRPAVGEPEDVVMTALVLSVFDQAAEKLDENGRDNSGRCGVSGFQLTEKRMTDSRSEELQQAIEKAVALFKKIAAFNKIAHEWDNQPTSPAIADTVAIAKNLVKRFEKELEELLSSSIPKTSSQADEGADKQFSQQPPESGRYATHRVKLSNGHTLLIEEGQDRLCLGGEDIHTPGQVYVYICDITSNGVCGSPHSGDECHRLSNGLVKGSLPPTSKGTNASTSDRKDQGT